MTSAPHEDVATLESLLSRVALRDQQAVRELYRRTAARLFAVALRIVPQRARAEELLQEAYINVWNNAASFVQHRGTPLTWLISIVRNKALDAARVPSRKISMTVPDDESEETAFDVADESAGPLEQLVERCDDLTLQTCLEALEPEARRSILLAFYEGLTHKQLADKLGRPLGTVKAWVRRGLERIKHCIEQAHGVAPAGSTVR